MSEKCPKCQAVSAINCSIEDCPYRSKVSAQELKPCPFCGGKAKPRSSHLQKRTYGYWVECTICEIATKYHPERSGAAQTWNTRPESPATGVSDFIYDPLCVCGERKSNHFWRTQAQKYEGPFVDNGCTEFRLRASATGEDGLESDNALIWKIVRMGLTGDLQGVRNYALFLATKTSSELLAKALREYADGDFGAHIVPMSTGDVLKRAERFYKSKYPRAIVLSQCLEDIAEFTNQETAALRARLSDRDVRLDDLLALCRPMSEVVQGYLRDEGTSPDSGGSARDSRQVQCGRSRCRPRPTRRTRGGQRWRLTKNE